MPGDVHTQLYIKAWWLSHSPTSPDERYIRSMAMSEHVHVYEYYTHMAYTYTYIHIIYTYICVSVCVCLCFYYVFNAFTPMWWLPSLNPCELTKTYKKKTLSHHSHEKESRHICHIKLYQVPRCSKMFQAAVVLQGVQNFDARLPLQGIGQQQAAPRTQHRGHALDEELGTFEGGAGLDAEDEVEGILGPWCCRGRGAAMVLPWHTQRISGA